MNISILGFGRIGRDLLRQTLDNDSINIVSISDIADKENLIYLLKYDTIYGKLDADIQITDTGFTISHRAVKRGRIHATCDIKANAFSRNSRKSIRLAPEVLKIAEAYIIPGMKDRFADKAL